MTPLEALHQQMAAHIEFRRLCGTNEGLRFLCIEDLVKQHGTVFHRSRKRGPTPPVPRLCFAQSYRMATRKGSKWIYCEGYAVCANSIGLAVNHAWVMDPREPGEAYDLAWPRDQTREESAYIGIPFRPEFVRDTHLASGRDMFSVLDTWWLHYPLLTGKVAIEDVIWRAA
jgi:hypothetical protein